MQEIHPLSGGLFSHLSSFQATMAPTTPGLLMNGPYSMVQQANNTQSLHEANKTVAKNVTKAAATNASKDSHVQTQANQTVVASKNQTVPSKTERNQTVVANKTALAQPSA